MNTTFVKSRLFESRVFYFIQGASRPAKCTKRSSIIRSPHFNNVSTRPERSERRAISNSSRLKGPRGSGVVGSFGCSLHRCHRAVTYPRRQRVRIRVKRTCPRDRRRGGETSQDPKHGSQNEARLSATAACGEEK